MTKAENRSSTARLNVIHHERTEEKKICKVLLLLTAQLPSIAFASLDVDEIDSRVDELESRMSISYDEPSIE